MVSHWYDAFGRFFTYAGPSVAAFIIEFIGTFFLVLTIGLTVTQNGAIFAPLAIGAMLMVMIFAGGHISGAHYNPAVTLGVRFTGRSHITTPKAFGYILLQVSAGILGASVAYGICGKTAAPLPGAGVSVASAFFVELLYTFALVSVMLNCATTKSQSSNSFFGLAIGFTVLSGAYSAGPISGGAFNPAVATGLTIVNSIVTKGEFKYIWVYWLAEVLAALLASIIFRLTNSAEYRHQAAIANVSEMSPEGYQKVPEDEI